MEKRIENIPLVQTEDSLILLINGFISFLHSSQQQLRNHPKNLRLVFDGSISTNNEQTI
jgi:hypothetical protein